jgi:hypothetical protein
LRKVVHTVEVDVHVISCFARIESLTDGNKKLAQTLDLLLFWVVDVREKLFDAFVHNTFRKHLELEEFSNELDQSETSTLDLLGFVVFLRIQNFLRSFAFSGVLLGLIDRSLVLIGNGGGRSLSCRPSLLEILLTTIEKILSEQLTTGDRVAFGVLDTLVLNVGTDLLHHLAT